MVKNESASTITWKAALKTSLVIYVPLRLALSIFVALIIWLAPVLALPPRAELMARWNIPLPEGRLADLLLTPWLRFDVLWYMKTALNGYGLVEPNIHHLPLYPLLMRGLHEIIGGHIAISALFISNIAFILGLAYAYRLARLDYRDSMAWRIITYLAIFPTAFFYLVGYTESLFLLGSVGAFYYARQRNWISAGLLGTVSALSRPQGVFILLPLLLEFLQQESGGLKGVKSGAFWKNNWFKVVPLLLIPLGVALYAFYLEMRFGLQTVLQADMNYWKMQAGLGMPGLALWLAFLALVEGLHPLNNSIDLAFAIFGLVMTIWAIFTLRPSYWLFMALNLFIVISRPIEQYPLLSMPRFILPLFPIYILLGQAGQASPIINRLIIYSCLALLIFFTAQFALGGWVA